MEIHFFGETVKPFIGFLSFDVVGLALAFKRVRISWFDVFLFHIKMGFLKPPLRLAHGF